MNLIKECPICEKEIISDATIIEFCKLCAMQVEKNNRFISGTNGSTNYYCSKRCFEKFKKFYQKGKVIQFA